MLELSIILFISLVLGVHDDVREVGLLWKQFLYKRYLALLSLHLFQDIFQMLAEYLNLWIKTIHP